MEGLRIFVLVVIIHFNVEIINSWFFLVSLSIISHTAILGASLLNFLIETTIFGRYHLSEWALVAFLDLLRIDFRLHLDGVNYLVLSCFVVKRYINILLRVIEIIFIVTFVLFKLCLRFVFIVLSELLCNGWLNSRWALLLVFPPVFVDRWDRALIFLVASWPYPLSTM